MVINTRLLGITSGSNLTLPGDSLSGALKKKPPPNSITDLFMTDLWVRRFVLDCADIFGVPSTSKACLSSKDKFLFAYGLMNITTAMRRMDSTWRGMHKKVDPKDAAWEFCRRFYEKYGDQVIPNSSEDTNAGIPIAVKKASRRFRSLPSGSIV